MKCAKKKKSCYGVSDNFLEHTRDFLIVSLVHTVCTHPSCTCKLSGCVMPSSDIFSLFLYIHILFIFIVGLIHSTKKTAGERK
mmetsp:Transcript_1501/g.2437  ORF Transcript_1501/g.2437 Transcript_1501/m.2437 type:complete len:83 (+) Transcript_1501:3939-4187(+)